MIPPKRTRPQARCPTAKQGAGVGARAGASARYRTRARSSVSPGGNGMDLLTHPQARRGCGHDPVAVTDTFKDFEFGRAFGADRNLLRGNPPVLRPPNGVLLDTCRREQESVIALPEDNIGLG